LILLTYGPERAARLARERLAELCLAGPDGAVKKQIEPFRTPAPPTQETDGKIAFRTEMLEIPPAKGRYQSGPDDGASPLFPRRERKVHDAAERGR
jgi:hypothetical protein